MVSNNRAIWQQAARATYQPSSPSCVFTFAYLRVSGHEEQCPVQRQARRVHSSPENIADRLPYVRVREHGHDLCTLLALSLALGEEDAVRQVPDVFRRKRFPVLVDFLTQVIQKHLKEAHDRAVLLRGPVLEERDDVLEEAVTHLLDELVEDGHEFLDVWVVEGFTLSEADSVDDVEHEKCGVEVRVKSAGLSDHLVGDHGDRLVHDLLEVLTPHVVPHGL